jgi:hypothetical protein
MTASDIQVTNNTPGASLPARAATDHAFGFHDVLSAINPLQYLPVVGTIYRAATGDVIPEALRTAGSLVVSGLLGGPIGLISNIVMTIAEKVTGIDPEKIVAAHLHVAPSAGTAATPVAAPVVTPVAAPDQPTLALSARQLAAYGVQMGASGTLQLGDVRGADVLNTIELARLGRAAAAYAANQSLAPAVRTAAR